MFTLYRFAVCFAAVFMSYDVQAVREFSRKKEDSSRAAMDIKNFVDNFLLALFCESSKDLGLHYKSAAYVLKRARCEGLAFFTQDLPALAKSLERGLSSGQFSCPSFFKRPNKSSLPSFLREFFSRIFDDEGVLLDEADPQSVLAIRQVCYLAYKAELPRDPSLDDAVIENFIKVEQELSAALICNDAILTMASALVSEITKGYAIGKTKHGPGVSANVAFDKKNEARLTAGLPSVEKHGSEFFYNVKDAFERVDRFPVWTNSDYFGGTATRNCARVILVPKDARGPRLISAEPFENQFIQQGIASWLVERLESHPLTAGHVNFRDQTINQNLAKEASSTKLWSTLDLKDASDRVSMQLVRHIFKEENLIADIESARSTHTELPKTVHYTWDSRPQRVELSKHAPMGSALCFPVMALSIWSLCVSGLIGLGVEKPWEKVYVFGDDIIVPTAYATFCIDVLEKYHLRVNREKSFINSDFAESCGGDYFRGHDVTPIRLHECTISKRPTRRKVPNLAKNRPPSLVPLVAKAHLFSRRALDKTAEYLYRYVEAWLGPLPYGHSSSPYLCRLAPFGLEDHIPEMNIYREGLMWKKAKFAYNHLGLDLRAWAVQPERVETSQTLYGALTRSCSAKTVLQRVRGRHGWSNVSVPEFVGTEPSLIDFGYVTKPRKYSLKLRRFDNYAMSPIKPWTGDLFV